MARARAAPALAGALLLFLFLLPLAAAAPARIEATDERVFNPHYAPFELTVQPGETVEVVNTGTDRHTFTSVDGAWQELDLASGATGLAPAPSEEGDYRFYCRYHSSPRAEPGEGMAGLLRVRAAQGGAQPMDRDAPLPWLVALAGLALAAAALRGRDR